MVALVPSAQRSTFPRRSLTNRSRLGGRIARRRFVRAPAEGLLAWVPSRSVTTLLPRFPRRLPISPTDGGGESLCKSGDAWKDGEVTGKQHRITVKRHYLELLLLSEGKQDAVETITNAHVTRSPHRSNVGFARSTTLFVLGHRDIRHLTYLGLLPEPSVLPPLWEKPVKTLLRAFRLGVSTMIIWINRPFGAGRRRSLSGAARSAFQSSSLTPKSGSSR